MWYGLTAKGGALKRSVSPVANRRNLAAFKQYTAGERQGNGAGLGGWGAPAERNCAESEGNVGEM